MPRTFTAIYEPAEEGGFVAWVEELPGAVTQGETLAETRENLKDAIQLILEVNRELAGERATNDQIRELITVGE